MFDLLLLSIADRKAHQWLATKHNEWFGRISPDGRWMAYRSNEHGSDEVLVRPFKGPTAEGTEPPGGRWQVSRTGVFPIWRADSRELLYIASNRDLMSVKVSFSSGSSFDFEPPQKLFTLPTETSFEVAENGSRILAFLPDERSMSSPITVVLNWEAMLLR